uniref:Uncharacterized protein n=1 Tax=Meloidogyne incognita TaxID=6306 RepID=A0A914LAJ0_MELIC
MHPNFSNEDMYTQILPDIDNKGETSINKMIPNCRAIKNSEINIFIIWHLFAFARKTIRSFILFYAKKPNDYDNILKNIWKFMRHHDNTFMQENISILSYFEAYDELEIKANNWMEIIKQLSIFKKENVYFNYKEVGYLRSKMLMSLQEAENSEENVIFPSSFKIDKIGDVQKHFPLLYRNFAIHEELTVNECQIVLQTFSNTEQTLYELVESLNNENLLIKLKLEKYVINPLLVNQMYANQPEYLQENTEHLGYGIVKPIQKRHEIVQLIRDVCGIPPGNN